MVTIISEKSEEQLQARQDATRSGSVLVPAVIREAGPKAVESYLCFFASVKSKQTGYVYRSAANPFFQWCGNHGLQLDGLKAGHVVEFFDAKRNRWKASTEDTFFYALRLLFGHLEADHILERSPFVGVKRPKRATTESDEQRLAKLTVFLRELDGYQEGSELYRPGLVAMFPLLFGSMEETKVAGVTGIPLEEVATYTGRLRTNGVWTEDGKLAIDSEDQTVSEFAVNMVLIIGCAAGLFKRFPVEEELKTSMPKAGVNHGESDILPEGA